MSLCINPRCPQPDHPGNDSSRFCQSCGTDLVLHDRYRVMRLISDRSGFGKVYEAYERNIPRILKVLKDIHNQNPKAIQLFEQEAHVLSQLHHPGVPRVEPDGCFQVWPREATEPLHCIVMEKIDGPNLREWMHQQGNHPISEKQALEWLKQVTEILHLVHQKNYFHRDIKPENLMLRSNGQLVLVDFGAAREMTYTYLAQLGGSAGVTRISSAGYTPPEQEKGQAVPQSDFYALGWTFIYLLTGKQPTDPSIYDSLNDEFHWRVNVPHISSEFADFIDRLIAPKASNRPKNTQEILNTLAQLDAAAEPRMMGVFSPSHSAPYASRSAPSAPQAHPLTRPQPATELQGALSQAIAPGVQPRFTRRRWWLGGATAIVLALAGFGGWVLYQRYIPVSGAPEVIRVEKTLEGHTGFINHLIFTPDGKQVISTGADSKIIVWDVDTGTAVKVLEGNSGYINALALSGNGRTLVSGGADHTILVWDLKTGELLRTLTGHTSPVNTLAISPDGILASGSADRTVRTWNLETGQLLNTFRGHDGFINSVVISPNAQILASGGADATILTWNLITGEELRSYSGYSGNINALIFSPDGTLLIGGSTDRLIHIWDVASGQETQTLTGHTGYVNTLMISGDGKRLLSSDADGTLIVWSLETGTRLHTYTGKQAPLDHVAASPDWKTIASGRGFRTVQIWELPTP